MNKNKRFVQKNNTIFSSYDEKHLDHLAQIEEKHFWFRNRRKKICEVFQKYVQTSLRILEIGCGTGFVAEKLKNLGFAIEVADLYSKGLLYAQKRGLSKLYQFDVFYPPFNEEFDVICFFDVLEHLQDPFLALECIKKMLKPSGMIILTVPAHQWLWSRNDVIARHQARFTKAQLKTLFLDSGFQPIEISYFFSAILPFLIVRKWMKKDDCSPLRKEEIFQVKVIPGLNKFCDLVTRLEFLCNRFIPNVAGGSLLGIAARKN